MENVMVDLETLGRRAGCAILSIGAVAFDHKELGSEFYIVLNRKDQILNGLHEDGSTLAWWAKQTEAARQVLEDAEKSKVTLKLALTKFNKYLEQFGHKKVCLWGNGGDFDLAILINLYAASGMEAPWQFWNHRCYRTLKNLFPKVKLERSGTYHNALDDAKTQARHAIQIMPKR